MKIGDRVIYDRNNRSNLNISGKPGIITEIWQNGKLLIKFDITENEFVSMWTFPSDIEIDKEWYREQKLKELGI